jgi:hypothetical protein
MTKGKKSYKKALRRKKTLFKKAYKLGETPKYKVLIFIRRRSQITTFRLIDNES